MCPPILIFLIALVITVPLASVFGALIGNLLNSMKGAEMIGGLILGYFADGLYQLLFLFIIGGVIPIVNKRLIINTGIGVKNTIDLASTKTINGVKYAIDDLWKIQLVDFVKLAFVLALIYALIQWLTNGKKAEAVTSRARAWIVVLGILAAISFAPPVVHYLRNIRI